MKVILAKSAGFCWGVKRAIDMARRLSAEKPGQVTTDGPLIHNPQMMDLLRSEGIKEENDPFSLKEGILIVRAHGISPERRQRLAAPGVTLVDATCPDVAKIQKTISQRAAADCKVLIFGDPKHAEVIGLAGCAGQNGFVVTSASDIASLPEMHPVCLVAQSTQMPTAFAVIAEKVRARFPTAEIIDTICRSTRSRQQEIVEMAASVDAFVVVGGSHSANTLHLVEVATSLKPTFHIETCADLRESDLARFKVVGLTAGASTPGFVIDEVVKLLESFS